MRNLKRHVFPLTTDAPEYVPTAGKYTMCMECPMKDECKERVKIGVWVMCEIPDELDMMRLNGG